MKTLASWAMGLTAIVLLGAWLGPALAADTEGNKRRGQVYYRMVCTPCHLQQAGNTIPPMQLTMAEWKAYIQADKHAKGGDANSSMRYYVSREYRQSIKDNNKAAAKFLDLPDAQLHADVRAFVISGAKDSDTPATCQ